MPLQICHYASTSVGWRKIPLLYILCCNKSPICRDSPQKWLCDYALEFVIFLHFLDYFSILPHNALEIVAQRQEISPRTTKLLSRWDKTRVASVVRNKSCLLHCIVVYWGYCGWRKLFSRWYRLLLHHFDGLTPCRLLLLFKIVDSEIKLYCSFSGGFWNHKPSVWPGIKVKCTTKPQRCSRFLLVLLCIFSLSPTALDKLCLSW